MKKGLIFKYMDISLNYVEKGKGIPLILLHGNGQSLSFFSRQMDAFARSYRVIAIDTRGHGKSPRGTALFSIEQFAEDLRAFMDEHQIPSAHILGYSDGGNIAIYFALEYPSRVRSLILNGANIDPSGIKRSVFLPISWRYQIASFFSERSEYAYRRAEMLRLMVEEPNIHPSALARLPMEALVIIGKRTKIREKHSRMIAAHIPRAELVILKGNHFIARKRAEAFNTAVLDFLHYLDT